MGTGNCNNEVICKLTFSNKDGEFGLPVWAGTHGFSETQGLCTGRRSLNSEAGASPGVCTHLQGPTNLHLAFECPNEISVTNHQSLLSYFTLAFPVRSTGLSRIPGSRTPPRTRRHRVHAPVAPSPSLPLTPAHEQRHPFKDSARAPADVDDAICIFETGSTHTALFHPCFSL